MVFRLTDTLFSNNAVIASESNERSNLPSIGSTFSLFLAESRAIIEFLLKNEQITAHAWQIASLVALARNDSVVLKKYPKTTSLSDST